MYRWSIILPMLFIMHGLSYLDRVNISFAMSGIEQAFTVTSTTAGIISGIVFLGFAILQIPAGHIACCGSARKIILIFGMLTGAFATIQGFSTSVEMLIICRFLLGLAEGALMPACLILISRWFIEGERGRATNIFMCYVAAAPLLMSPICGAILTHVHWLGLESWRWMLILEGIIPFFWAILFYFVVTDTPRQAKGISAKELACIEAAHEIEAQKPRIIQGKSYWRCALNRNFICFVMAWLLMAVAHNGVTIWLPEIIKQLSNMGYSQIGWVATVPWLCTLIGLFVIGYINDKWKNRKKLLIVLESMGAVGLFGSAVSADTSLWLSIGLITLAMTFAFSAAPTFADGMNEFVSPQMLGGLMGIALTVVNAGGFLGPSVAGYFIALAGGNKIAGVLFLAGCYLLSAVFMSLCDMKRRKAAH